MTSRERVRRAITFQGPDRIPINHAIFPGALKRHGQAILDLVAEFPDDFGNGAIIGGQEPDVQAGEIEEYRDGWGSQWLRLEGYTAGEVVRPGLPDWSEFKDYRFPPNTPQKTFDEWRAKLDESHEHWVNGGGGALFEQLQWIRGPENLYMDLAEDRAELHELADRLVEYFIVEIEGAIFADVDGIGFADDWGSQRALLISPEQWRSFFKPRYARLFAQAKNAGKPVFFHTDGWTLDILEDLVEIGVNVLNPQHTLMGEERLGKLFGGRVAIRSDLDRQRIIPRGSREEIREHVKAVIRAFGSHNGGLILHGEVGQDVPLENVRCMLEAFREFGEYPLNWL